MAMVLEQDWRPKDLPPLNEVFNGSELVTLFLPDMKVDDAREFLPWDNTAPIILDFGYGHRLMMPSRH